MQSSKIDDEELESLVKVCFNCTLNLHKVDAADTDVAFSTWLLTFLGDLVRTYCGILYNSLPRLRSPSPSYTVDTNRRITLETFSNASSCNEPVELAAIVELFDRDRMPTGLERLFMPEQVQAALLERHVSLVARQSSLKPKAPPPEASTPSALVDAHWQQISPAGAAPGALLLSKAVLRSDRASSSHASLPSAARAAAMLRQGPGYGRRLTLEQRRRVTVEAHRSLEELLLWKERELDVKLREFQQRLDGSNVGFSTRLASLEQLAVLEQATAEAQAPSSPGDARATGDARRPPEAKASGSPPW